ncbi:MAG: AAA family ATPase, partial [Pyrinomonadaceae bacterium]
MHITRVELENIKSYERGEFNFLPGTTAIVGRNGAGKTTILEAIAWALFDTLDYSKDDFLRRGAKKGWVRVSFESDLDGRQYTVYRDTANGYYVHDPALNAKVAEKKLDVGTFLRQHLGTEPGTDLQALFRSAVGVPQGTLTADFLKPASQRKASFDPLLKVEEYLKGADRLRDTLNLIRDRTIEAHKRIANAEGQLARYDELVAEHDAATKRAEELTHTLVVLRRETKEREARVAEMDQTERRANEAQSAVERLEVERQAAEVRLRDLETALAAAREASDRQRATIKDYEAHLAAQERLRGLEQERAERERLREEARGMARAVDAAKNELRRLSDALGRAAGARESLVALRDEIARQEELERERERLRDLLAQARAAGDRVKRLDRELEELRAQHTHTKQRVQAAEKAQGAEQQSEQLESERLGVETRLSKIEKELAERGQLERQRESQTREVERVRRSVAALERELKQLTKASAEADRAGELEMRERELAQQAARLRAQIEHGERMCAEARNGMCPILGERCTSFGEGQTVDGYFRDQSAVGREQLATVEAESKQLVEAVRRARAAATAAAQLVREESRLADERRLFARHEAKLAEIDAELTKFAGATKELRGQLAARMLGIDAALKTTREDALRAAELAPLRARLEEIAAEGKRKREERDELAAVSGAVESLNAESQTIEQDLRALDDPRGRAAALKSEAAREAALKTEVEAARAALSKHEEERRACDARLERFSELDAKWSEATAVRDRTAAAHQEYLTSKALADTLPAREAEARTATEAAARATAAAQEARAAYAQSLAAYDRARHDLERGRLALARETAAKSAAQLEAAQASAEKLQAEIARLDGVRDQWREEKRKEEHLGSLSDATDFVRDTLKKAGPLVTESYLYNISIEANQL